MDCLCRTWATVDLDCIRQNLRTVKGALQPGCGVMAVVKADAYGHGDGQVAKALQQEGVAWFAVSNLNEALSLRGQGIDAPVLVLGYTPPVCAGELAEQKISQTVFSEDYAGALSAAAVAAGVEIDCHIKVDTGMSRIGFYALGQESEAAAQIAEAYALPGLRCTGIFTHFACADECSDDSDRYTRAQFLALQTTMALLEERGIRFALRHCCNSAATLRFPSMHLDLVRAGVILYGMNPSVDCRDYCGALRPAMSLYSVVTMVKELEAEAQISYGRCYTVPEGGRRIATVAVGYADGYRRSFSNRADVLVRGRPARVVGRICMDQMMIDVTEIPDVHPGDRVTLVGSERDVAVSFDDFARLNDSINYEESCLIGRRVPRVYLEGGREVASVDYLMLPLSPQKAKPLV